MQKANEAVPRSRRTKSTRANGATGPEARVDTAKSEPSDEIRFQLRLSVAHLLAGDLERRPSTKGTATASKSGEAAARGVSAS